MSSPVQGSTEGSLEDQFQGDADEQTPLSDLQHEAETRRLQKEVVDAARRLEREAAEHAPLTGFQLQDNTISFRIPVVRRSVERQSQEDTNERVWSALRSEFLPPSQQGLGIPRIALITGSMGAVLVAAAVALLVVNLIQLPSRSVSASGEDEVAKNESFSSTAVNLAKIVAAQAKMQPADDEPQAPAAPIGVPALSAIPAPAAAVPAPTGLMLATASPGNDIAAAKAPAPLRPPSSEIKPSPSPEIKPAAIESPPPPAAASSPPASSPPPAVAPEPQPTVTLSQDEIASLLKRGRDLIAAGDIASARLVLTHLADAGVAEASFVLAGTFDPSVLESLRIVGMRPDPAKARLWYSRAAEQGSVEARQRLQALR